MKVIGLLGGMSWESTVTYYQVINSTIKEQLGGLHSAKIVLYSVDFHVIEQCQSKGNWDESAAILIAAANNLKSAGADYIVICTNTMHKVASHIQKAVNLPILHIAEVTADAIKSEKLNCVALLGTRYTMEEDFYKQIIIDSGIKVIVPDENDRQIINDIIYNELCLGVINEKSRQTYFRIMDKMIAAGAQGIILGCTEIGLLVSQSDIDIPLFDTSLIHAREAALKAINSK